MFKLSPAGETEGMKDKDKEETAREIYQYEKGSSARSMAPEVPCGNRKFRMPEEQLQKGRVPLTSNPFSFETR